MLKQKSPLVFSPTNKFPLPSVLHRESVEGKYKYSRAVLNAACCNTIKPIRLVIIEAGRPLLMCDFVPTGLPRTKQNVHNLQGPLNLPTKVGIQMLITHRHAFMSD